MMSTLDALVKECKNQAQSCLYTSTSLFIWLRCARWINRTLNGIQIIVGVVAAASAINEYPAAVVSVIALLAAVLPSIYEKLNLNAHVEEIEIQAGQYKNLQDRFRQAGDITAIEGEDALKTEFSALMRQLEDLRAKPITVPEWCFKKAQEKIKAGHYKFDTP